MQNYVVNCMIGFLAVMAICQTTFGRTTSLFESVQGLTEEEQQLQIDNNSIYIPTTSAPRKLVKHKHSRRILRPFLNVTLDDVIDERIRLEEGQSYILECTIAVNSTAVVYSYGQEELTSQLSLPSTSSGSADYQYISAQEKHLINCASKKDEGEIKCVAIAAEKTIEKRAIITVEASDRSPSCPTNLAPVITSSTLSIIAPMETPITIKCRAQGSPRIIIDWFDKEGNKINKDNSDGFVILNNGDLFIEKLVWPHMGTYTCVASSAQGRDKTHIFVYPTKV